MMALVDRPFIQHQLDHLRRFGIQDVVFSCGYLPDQVVDYFGDGSALGMRLTYVVDPFPLGTAGAIKNAEPHLGSGDFLVLNGDILTDLDLAELQAAHGISGASGTIALTPVEDPSAFGLVRLHPDRSVDAFLEKPAREDLLPGEPFNINAGTYLMSRDVLAEIPDGVMCSIERDIFPKIAAAGRLFGHPNNAYWRDIGTHRSYLDAHLDVLTGRVRTESPTGVRYLGVGAIVAPGAEVSGGSSIGAGASVGPGACVTGSVIGDGVKVARGARVDGAIVGAGARIDDGANIGPGVVVGDGARVGGGSSLVGTVLVDTHAHLQPGTQRDGSQPA